MNRTLLVVFLAFGVFQAKAQFGVTGIALSPSYPSPCDSVTFTVTGNHDQGNIVNYWLHDTIRNDSVIFTVHAVIPPMSVGGLTPFTLSTTLPPFPKDTFILHGRYVASIPTFPPATVTDTMIIDTMLFVDAGPDTSFCDGNFIQLGAFPPPPSMTGSWTVIQGNATLNSSIIHDPIASNLSYGENVFVWSMPGNTCMVGGSDTVTLFNSQKPSDAVVESDFIACENNTTINAQSISSGHGYWQVTTGSSILSNPMDTICGVTGLSLGVNSFLWTVEDTNGLCADKSDNLDVDFRKTSAVSIIRVSDTLLAGSAPRYQWYKDNQKLIGDTANKLLISSNGTYKVQTNAIGCDNGPFSNEIIVDDILGILENASGQVIIAPNPAQNFIRITLKENKYEFLQVYDSYGRVVISEMPIGSTTLHLDISSLNNGIYILNLKGQSSSYSNRFFKE